MHLPLAIRKKARKYTQAIWRSIEEEGYKGYFELDFKSIR